MKKEKHRIHFKNSDLKITPQRMAVLEALKSLKEHPTADKIKEYVVKNHPNIAVGTIFKTFETFVEKGLVRKVKTEKDVMRYDAILEKHHHLYCEDTEHIEDYLMINLIICLKYILRKRKYPTSK